MFIDFHLIFIDFHLIFIDFQSHKYYTHIVSPIPLNLLSVVEATPHSPTPSTAQHSRRASAKAMVLMNEILVKKQSKTNAKTSAVGVLIISWEIGQIVYIYILILMRSCGLEVDCAHLQLPHGNCQLSGPIPQLPQGNSHLSSPIPNLPQGCPISAQASAHSAHNDTRLPAPEPPSIMSAPPSILPRAY